MNEYIKQLSNLTELLSDENKNSTSHYIFNIVSDFISHVEEKGVLQEAPLSVIKATESALTVKGEIDKQYKEYLKKKFPDYYLNSLDNILESFNDIPFLSIIEFLPRLLPYKDELTVEHMNFLFKLALPKKTYSDYGYGEEKAATHDKMLYLVKNFLTKEIFYSPEFKFADDLNLYTKTPTLTALFDLLKDDIRTEHKTEFMAEKLIDRMIKQNVYCYLSPNLNKEYYENIKIIKSKLPGMNLNNNIIDIIINDDDYVEKNDSTKTLYKKITKLISGNHLTELKANGKPLIFSLLMMAPCFYIQSFNASQRKEIFNYFGSEDSKHTIIPYLLINKNNALSLYKEELSENLKERPFSILEDMVCFINDNPDIKITSKATRNPQPFTGFCQIFERSPVDNLNSEKVKNYFSIIFNKNINWATDLLINLPENTAKFIDKAELTKSVCYYLEKNAGVSENRKDSIILKYVDYIDADIFRIYERELSLNNAQLEAWQDYNEKIITQIEKQQLTASFSNHNRQQVSNKRL